MEKFKIIFQEHGYNEDVGSWVKDKASIMIEADDYCTAYDMASSLCKVMGFSDYSIESD